MFDKIPAEKKAYLAQLIQLFNMIIELKGTICDINTNKKVELPPKQVPNLIQLMEQLKQTVVFTYLSSVCEFL